MSSPRLLTGEEIQGLIDYALPEQERDAFADLAHTALEAMRREQALIAILRPMVGVELCCCSPCEEFATHGLRIKEQRRSRWYCPTHAPAGSVRVVP